MLRMPIPVPPARRLIVTALAAALVAACGGSTSVTPAPATPANPTPVIPSPSASPQDGGTYWLRMSIWQAIPPVNLFELGNAAIIDGAGLSVVPGAVAAIYPGPLVMPLFARQVSDTGRETILGWAHELGLLSGKTDFTDGAGMPGGMTGRIELTVDGRLVTLTGIPDMVAPDPEPGSPQAFGELWRRVAALPETLPAELGPEAPYVPSAYAILVGPAPEPEAGMQANLADWPLETPLATFGGPVQDGSYRCGIVEGEDAVTLRPALEAANQLTQWVQDPETSATFGLTVRAIVAGENPCLEVFGL